MRPVTLLSVLLAIVCSPVEGLHAESPRISLPILVHDTNPSALHQCAQTSLTVNETAGVATFELIRSRNTTATTTGYVQIWGNWLLDTHGIFTVSFAPGETTRLINVPLINDSVYSGTQQTRFTCGGQGAGVSETTFDGMITVFDDEPYPTAVAPASIEVTETDAPQHVTIPISFVPPFGYQPNIYVVLEHNTTDDQDLELLTTYPFNKIELEIKGDDLPESDESLVVHLTGELQKWISVTIRDDDRPPFPYAFDQDRYELDEVQGGSVVISRTGSLSAPAQLLLKIRPTIPGPTFDAIPVLFAPGESSKEVPLPLDDPYFTGTRYLILELELDGFVGATASLTVRDDEAMPSLSIGDASVREGNLDQHPRLEVPVTLTAPVGYAIRVGVSPSHVTTDANDFAAVAQTATIFAGELAGTAVFDVNGDIEFETDETFNVTVTSCCDGLATVARRTSTATIVNDDGVPTETVYRLALGATTFEEKDKWLSIPVRRFGRVTGTTHAILKLTASNERAFAPRTVSFAANETANDVRFYIEDFWYSGDTIVKVELFDGDRLLETGAVTILENEEKPRTWIYGGTAREGNATNAVPFTIHVYPPSGKPVFLHLHARSGTAENGVDFPPFDTTVEIPPATYDYELAVPIHNDLVPEKTENFFVDILSADDASIFAGYAPASIEDDDTVYVESEPMVLRGTLTTISVQLASPAPSQDSILFLADPAILEGPLSIPVPKGARSVSFQAMAKRAGDVSFAIGTPAFLPAARLNSTMTIFDEHTVTLTPAALELAPGTFARVVLTVGPTPAGFTASSPDRLIAATETATLVDGKPSFLVYGMSPGQTEILVKLLAASGGATARLPVVVKEPSVPVTRKRGVRH